MSVLVRFSKEYEIVKSLLPSTTSHQTSKARVNILQKKIFFIQKLFGQICNNNCVLCIVQCVLNRQNKLKYTFLPTLIPRGRVFRFKGRGWGLQIKLLFSYQVIIFISGFEPSFPLYV